MKKRMLYYLSYYEEITKKSLTAEEAIREKELLLIQIQFFQHERLIHLIVTVLFALLTVMSIFATLLIPGQPALLVLDLLFLVLLVPYIAHYYLLENGVQKLYTCYDRLVEKS
jgi:hypothetical protein